MTTKHKKSALPIPIRNLYVMLAYAFKNMKRAGDTQLLAERFEHIHDFLAFILIQEVAGLMKRGLNRGYRTHTEESATPRGQIDIAQSIAAGSQTRGRMVCRSDDLNVDTPQNQALKAVLLLLFRHGGLQDDLKQDVQKLLAQLSEVTQINPATIRWSELTGRGSTSGYRYALGVCKLLAKGLIHTEQSGEHTLGSWESEHVMNALYEKFLLEFYRAHYPGLSPDSSAVAWDLDPAEGRGWNASQLPGMKTDITLSNGTRTLIIDAKYYQNTMQSNSTARSAHLYQMFAYVKNSDVNGEGSVRGLLLYAQPNKTTHANVSVKIQGNWIEARTLDLRLEWEKIRAELEEPLKWFGLPTDDDDAGGVSLHSA